jgi:site-specific recombinase XerD
MATSNNHKPKTRRGSGTMQFLTQEELKRLFAMIKDKRDKALFLLAYRYGLRASEIGLLQRTDASPYLFISNRGVPIGRRTLWCAMQTYGKKAGVPPEKRKFHSLKHSISTHLLDARGELRFVQDWVGHKNVQNTTKYAQLTNPRRDEEARRLFADHRVV